MTSNEYKKYSDLINQTYYFPQEEFTNKDNSISQYRFNEIGGLKFTHLNSNNINSQKIRKSMEKQV
jgi:arginine decarboxylase